VDLSSAFDVVNIDLLVKRLSVLGFPQYLINIIKDWLSDRSAYVEVSGVKSATFTITNGTIQGSINGPNFYSLYVNPILERVDIQAFADDKVTIHAKQTPIDALLSCAEATQDIIKWFKESGLAVNPDKTEVCLFTRNKDSIIPSSITICEAEVRVQDQINVLGILFDQKLTWIPQLQQSLNKAARTRRGIGMIQKFFNEKELMKLASSLFYSRLYYGAEVWLDPVMTKQNESRLLSSSNSILNIVRKGISRSSSSKIDLHKSLNQATPRMWADYVTAKALHRVLSTTIPSSINSTLTINALTNSRFKGQLFTSSANMSAGKNSLANRVTEVSKKMTEDWMIMNKVQFKNYASRLFLTHK
jgi:hypothetical protein